MRVATRNKKTRERIGQARGSGLGCVDVEMPKRSTDVPTVIYRPSQFPRGPPRFVSLNVDTSTVLGQELMSDGSSIPPGDLVVTEDAAERVRLTYAAAAL